MHTQLTNEDSSLSWIPESVTVITEPNGSSCSNEDISSRRPSINTQNSTDNYLAIPSTSIATSNSLDTLTESTMSGPSSPSNLSAVTLVGSTGSGGPDKVEATMSSISLTDTTTDESKEFKYGMAPKGPLPERRSSKVIVPSRSASKDEPSRKDSIITYALPPTVTTTHYCSDTPTSSRKNLLDDPSVTMSSPLHSRQRAPSISATGLLPHAKHLMDRRPSAGANIIPHAALCQHRHSLQLNGDGGGIIKVNTNLFLMASF